MFSSGAVLKQNASNQASGGWMVRFNTGSDNSTFHDAVLDGNSDAALATLVLPSGAAISALRITDNVKGIKLYNTRVDNILGRPYLATNGGEGHIVDVMHVTNQAAPFGMVSCVNPYISNVHIDGVANQGLTIQSDGFQITGCTSPTVRDISLKNLSGDAASPSNFAQCAVVSLCKDGLFDGILFDVPEGSFPSHGLSNPGNERCTFTNMRILGHKFGLEFSGSVGCTISDFIIDGMYNTTTAVPSVDSVFGMTTRADSLETGGPSQLSGAEKNVFSNGIVMRNGWGLRQKSMSETFNNVLFVANTNDGLDVDEQSTSVSFPDIISGDLAGFGVVYNNCSFSQNGRMGVDLRSCNQIIFNSCKMNDNGWNETLTNEQRAGVSLATTLGSNLGPKFIDNNFSVKNTTVSGSIASFEPNNVVSDVGVFSVIALRPIEIGQIFDIDADGIGTLMRVRVTGRQGDDFNFVRISGPSNFTYSGGTGSGTWTTDGTDPTKLNGVGGLAEGQLRGRVWIRANGEYRQVDFVLDDNTIFVTEAFTSPISGASINRIFADIASVPTQHYGLNFQDSGDADNVYLKGNISNKNITSNLNIWRDNVATGSRYRIDRITTAITGSANTTLGVFNDGQSLLGYRFMVTESLAGTDGTITIRQSGGIVGDLITGLAITQNTKHEGYKNARVEPTGAVSVIAQLQGGADNIPSAGEYRFEVEVENIKPSPFDSV
jgi:hypothetical protein